MQVLTKKEFYDTIEYIFMCFIKWAKPLKNGDAKL